MTIEANFDVPLVAAMALKEKQIQQNYRPIIAVHKWFARRPGTLFRGLILSEFGDRLVQLPFHLQHKRQFTATHRILRVQPERFAMPFDRLV